MPALESVRIGRLPIERFESILPAERYAEFRDAVERSRRVFAGRAVWNVNSTSRGGGVAEMLVSLLAYAHGAGVDARWMVISGNDPFFALTKRIHNNLHNAPGDGGELGDEERRIYDETLRPNIEEFLELVSDDDVVIVHDPQPAGLIPPLKERGIPVIWRCHVGIDTPSDLSRRAWGFLRPYVEPADAYVFSRKAFVWEGLEDDKINLIAPVIDAFSAKNQELDPETVRAILHAAGLSEENNGASPTFSREDGTPDRVNRHATVWEGRPLRADDPMVLQVSRWDRLKDPIGVIEGFLDHVAPHTDAHLVYAGPAVEAVADDPEGKEVLDEAQGPVRGPVAREEGAPPPHRPADGRPRGERGDGQRPAAARRRGRAEEHRRGLRTHGGGGHVEGPPGRGEPDRRHPGPDRGRRERRAARRRHRPRGLRRRRHGTPHGTRPGPGHGDGGAGTGARRLPRGAQPHAISRT